MEATGLPDTRVEFSREFTTTGITQPPASKISTGYTLHEIRMLRLARANRGGVWFSLLE
jgi:hypothetical protein